MSLVFALGFEELTWRVIGRVTICVVTFPELKSLF